MKNININFNSNLIWFFLLLMLSFKSFGQNPYIRFNIQVLPPYTHQWQQYIGTDASRQIITVTNTSGQEAMIYLGGSFINQSGDGILVPQYPLVGEGNLLRIPPGTSFLQTGTIANHFEIRDQFKFQGRANQLQMMRGVIPEGTYRLCLQAYEPTNGFQVSDPLFECSNPIQVIFFNPPRTTQPICGNTVQSFGAQNINFAWTPPFGSSSGAVAWQYEFTLVLVPPTLEINNAINNATYQIYRTTTSAPILPYTAALPPLVPGQQYAWRVKAIDPSGQLALSNNGFSETCTFVYGDNTSAGIQPVFPANNEWIPLRQFPLIVKFSPYSNLYKSFRSTVNLRTQSGTRYPATRILSWPDGPQVTQQIILRTPGLTEEEASNIAVFPGNEGTMIGREIPLERGKSYNWDGAVVFGKTAGQSSITEGSPITFSASFKAGMGPSLPRLPANNDSVAPGIVSFSWQTAAPPARLFPDILVNQASRRNMSFFDGTAVEEKWIFELSRTNNFNTLLHTESGNIGLGINMREDPAGAIEAAIYKDINISKNLTDTGTYYWRVKWVNNPTSASDTTAYVYSEMFKFRIGSPGTDSALTNKEIPPTPTACVAACDAPTVMDRLATNNAVPGTIVQVGLFRMTITEIRFNEGLTARGKGNIHVPFLRSKILVEFDNIKINASNQVFDGRINAIFEQNVGLTDAQIRNLSRMTGIDSNQIRNISNLYGDASRLVGNFNGTQEMRLPLGFNNTVEGVNYVIGIVGMYFTPQRATFNAMIKVDFEEAQGWLSLGASDLCFHPNGLAGLGRGMLYNPTDKVIKFGETDLIFKKTIFQGDDYNTITDSGTYVIWDCEGFKALRVKGEVHFGRDILLPENPQGVVQAGIVKGYFEATLRRAKNFILRYTMDRFQPTGAPGWGFEIQEAYLDFSDHDNPTGLSFPSEYTNKPPILTHWRGFYLKRFGLHFPPEFEANNQPTRRANILAQNIFIDRNGFTGVVKNSGSSILTTEQCQVDGWGFGIDSVYFRMVQNNLQEAWLNGKLLTPISPTPLSYLAGITKEPNATRLTYTFNVVQAGTLQIPMWIATAELTGSSFGFNYTAADASGTEAQRRNTGFHLNAILNGKITIDGAVTNREVSSGGTPLRMPEIGFNNLRVQSREPYVGCVQQTGDALGCVSWRFNSPQKSVSGFPVQIDGVNLVVRGENDIHLMEINQSPGPRLGLQIRFSVNPDRSSSSNTNSSTSSTTFRCRSALSIMGRLNRTPALNWELTGIVIDSVIISGENQALKVEGSAIFYTGDETFGNGFKGEVGAEFGPGRNFKLRALAQFGTKVIESNPQRYWRIDGMFQSGAGIPIGGGVSLYGFGGGAYYNMQIQTPAQLNASSTTESPANRARSSGAVYIPSTNEKLGIRANLLLGLAKREMFNASAGLGFEINLTQGSLDLIQLTGEANFLSAPGNGQSSVNASMDLKFWTDMRAPGTNTSLGPVFDGVFDVRMHVAGGVVRGAGTNNNAGRIHMYFSRDKWFVKMGEPIEGKYLGVKLTIPGVELELAQLRAYMMVGHDLPPMPPIPQNILSCFPNGRLPSSVPRNNTTPENADGFALGMNFGFDTGDKTWSIFKYKFWANVGFDVEIKKQSFACGLPSGGSFNPGIDGWYARGQAYAGLGGGVGVKLPLSLTDDYINIASFSAAAVLQAALPNPWWLRGDVAVNLNLLGLIRIENATLGFEIGERCSPVYESPLANIEIIADLTPPHDPQFRNPVDPLVAPTVLINYQQALPFAIEVLKEERVELQIFRVRVNQFQLYESAAGTNFIQVNNQFIMPYGSDMGSIALPNSGLKPNTRHRALAQAVAEKFSFGTTVSNLLTTGGSTTVANTTAGLIAMDLARNNPNSTAWQISKRKDNSEIRQEKRHDFVTGPMPETFNDDQIRFTYPYRRQRYFLQAECQAGRIEFFDQLRMNIFNPDPDPAINTTHWARVVALDGSTSVDLPININRNMPRASSGAVLSYPQISWQMPNLANNKTYAVLIIKKRNSNNPTSTNKISTQETASLGKGTITVNRKYLGPLAPKDGETVMYALFFRTSQFNTLQQKVASMQQTSANRTLFLFTGEEMRVTYQNTEPFDVSDVVDYNHRGVYYPAPLRLEMQWNQNWHTQFANRYIYNILALNEYRNATGGLGVLTQSEQMQFGTPPVRAIKLDEGSSHVRDLLLPGECRPVNPSNPVFASFDFSKLVIFNASINRAIGSAIPPQFANQNNSGSNTIIDYNASVVAMRHWFRVRQGMQRIVSLYGSPEQTEFPFSFRPLMRKVLDNQYDYLYRGNYPIRFYYIPPGSSCTNPDNNANLLVPTKDLTY